MGARLREPQVAHRFVIEAHLVAGVDCSYRAADGPARSRRGGCRLSRGPLQARRVSHACGHQQVLALTPEALDQAQQADELREVQCDAQG